jgi:glycosyltransferase involved in cell wall biosynthesis
MIKLSIITINYNNINGLQKTIESVLNQTYTNYEYIIIDGGSSDGDKEIIEKYSDKISYWVSEKDKGIYNAMNKGIKQARGEYCLFLNSGDYFVNENVLQKFLNNTNKEDLLYGDVITDKGLISYNKKLTFVDLFLGTICHQAVFIKTILFKKYGLYDESLTIVADWSFFLKVILIEKCSYKYINEILCKYDYNGISSNPKFSTELYKQRETVLKSMFPLMYDDYVELLNLRKNLRFYESSNLVQLSKKIQQSKIYKIIRGVQ